MTFDAERLYELLPAVYRQRDGEGVGGASDTLRGLIEVIAHEVAVLEEDLAQLYDDQFIETAAEWVVPYLGDLLGYRTIHGLAERVGSPRAEVANTIAYRRRKGTAAVLEQLARDVTGWDARAVEYFQLLATTQYLNHPRPQNRAWFAVRPADARPRVDGPFDLAAHGADVRRIARRRGRHNIPNVGIHAWRLRDHPMRQVPAEKLVAAAGDRRYLFNPLRADLQLFSHPEPEEAITHLAERQNVTDAITRRELWHGLDTFYPRSIEVIVDGTVLPPSAVAASDLSDVAGGWAYPAVGRALIDPVLGRLSLPASLTVDGSPVNPVNPLVAFSYASPADIGGGPYARLATFSSDLGVPVPVVPPGTIAAALATVSGSGVIEVDGNARMTETLSISAADGARIELRAAEGSRPVVDLSGPLEIELGDNASLTLNGLVLTGAVVRVPAGSSAGRLRLVHCTLVPGIRQKTDGAAEDPGAPSLVILAGGVQVELERCIVGGIRANRNATVRVRDSIIDASGLDEVAYAAPTGKAAGGDLELVASTVIGKVHARVLRLVSNTILSARLGSGDTWDHPVIAERRQEGCVRFSYVPPGSLTPSRFRCQPAGDADAVRVQPQLTSTRYGEPGYGQLSLRCPHEIRSGADDESEMGAFHHVLAPQRESNLHVRLEEYLRFGLEAGVTYAT